MKKAICVVLIICLFPVIALADVDIKSMNYDDLVKLQKKIAAEIMSRPEWQGVKVPAGSWRVGDDIPAGYYSISTDKYSAVTVWKKQIDDFSDGGLYYSEVINSDKPCGKIILKTGMMVVTSAETVFAPPLMLGF